MSTDGESKLLIKKKLGEIFFQKLVVAQMYGVCIDESQLIHYKASSSLDFFNINFILPVKKMHYFLQVYWYIHTQKSQLQTYPGDFFFPPMNNL